MFTIGSLKIPHRLVMAPMCGISNQPFRQICKGYGAGLVYTQMVSAKALTLGDKKTRRLLIYDESERPIAFQLFGNNPDVLAEAARIAQDMGPDLVDLNMGCPAKKIVDDGGGSALLKDPHLARQIFEKMRSVLKIPFTVKMRSGWDEGRDLAIQIAKIAEECGLDAVTLHARTKEQGYSEKADWDLIRLFKKNLSIPVIGNGDVTSFMEANRMLNETGCDAVMAGRAVFSAPWFFKSYLDQKEYVPLSDEIRGLITRQYEMFFDFFGTKTGICEMRKFLCAYTKGMRNSAAFRNRVISMNEWPLLRNSVSEFFSA